MKKNAFTLSEVLIAVLIIGVIAALTMPALISEYKKKTYISQLKMTYSQLVTSIGQVMIDENANDEIKESDNGNGSIAGFYTTTAGLKTSGVHTGAQYFLSTYFKSTKKGYGTSSVMAPVYTTPSNVALGTVDSNYYCINMQNESSICMKFEDNISKVIIDVNGAKNPNKSGEDLFVMKINNDGSVSDLDNNGSNCNVSSTGSSSLEKYASGCLTKIMQNGWDAD